MESGRLNTRGGRGSRPFCSTARPKRGRCKKDVLQECQEIARRTFKTLSLFLDPRACPYRIGVRKGNGQGTGAHQVMVDQLKRALITYLFLAQSTSPSDRLTPRDLTCEPIDKGCVTANTSVILQTRLLAGQAE